MPSVFSNLGLTARLNSSSSTIFLEISTLPSTRAIVVLRNFRLGRQSEVVEAVALGLAEEFVLRHPVLLEQRWVMYSPVDPTTLCPVMIADRLRDLDTSLFSTIESQTTEPDRQSLLALHAAIAERGPFDYLEIGSHLGGSLQALVADERCRSIISIDTRPLSQPDDRGDDADYPDNSTERMLELLSSVPEGELSKVTTFERGTSELSVTELPVRPGFCFVDAEHTRAAALRDALFCLDATTPDGVIAFHDSNVVMPGIEDFLAGLDRAHQAFQMPDSVFVVELGDPRLRDTPYVQRALVPIA